MSTPSPAPPRTPVPPAPQVADSQRDAPRRVNSESLLNGGNELLIEHRGLLYRLRQTSLGKLILTK